MDKLKVGAGGMLEARHFKTVDVLSPFTGVITNRLCAEENAAPVTNILVSIWALRCSLLQKLLSRLLRQNS